MQPVILVLTILRPNINKCKLIIIIYTQEAGVLHCNPTKFPGICPTDIMLRSPKFLEAVSWPPRHAKQVAVVIQWFNVNIIIDHCLLLITWWLKKYEPLDEYGSVSSRREFFSIFRKSLTPKIWQSVHKFPCNQDWHRWELILAGI